MRHKRLKLSVLLLLGLTGIHAQTMYVEQSTGMQTAYALSTVRKMTFSAGNLTLTKTDNTSGAYALNGLRHLNFTNLTTNLDEQFQVQEQFLNAYPNPASNVLNIGLRGIAHGEIALSIINIEGQTVLNRQLSHTGVLSVDISHLPKGIYVCRISNQTENNTIKIIKQ